MNTDDISVIEGVLMKATQPSTFMDKKGKPVGEFCKLGIKTDDGLRIMISLNTKSMGWSGALKDSKIWYRDNKKGRDIKTSMNNPTRFIGQRLRAKGILTPIDIKLKMYKLGEIREIVLLLES